jgi:4-aminobutyrate aminotransferase-like enzyme
VGFGGGTVKIAPPLVITEEAIVESTAVLQEAFAQALSGRHAMASHAPAGSE